MPCPAIRDVARVCDVSVATVSYVINGTRVLKQETRERVLRAMEDLNYHPSAVARGLSSKRVHTIGVHCGVVRADQVVTNSYAAGILGGILSRAQEREFDVTIFTQGWRDAATSAPPLGDGRTDGIIALAPPLGCDMLAGLTGLGLPTVGIASPLHPHADGVDVDNYAGAQLAARHLIALGHTRIAAILGDEDMASYAPRALGFCEALRAQNIEVRADWLLSSRFDGSLAAAQTRALLNGADAPTAIFSGNDTIAIAIMEAASALGLDVPSQLSVVGFDDVPLASVVSPNLTTIRQPLAQIGARAASLLIDQLQEKVAQSGTTHLLQPELIVRHSTAPFPAAATSPRR